MDDTTYQCPENPKHRQTVCRPVKEVFCGRHNKLVKMVPLPSKEEK